MERWPGWKIEVEVECESSPALYGYEDWHETEFYIAPEVADLARRARVLIQRALCGSWTQRDIVIAEKLVAELEQIAGK